MSDVQQELADWIDTDVIAQHILEEMEENRLNPTLENAKDVWLDVLETALCDAIKSAIEAIS